MISILDDFKKEHPEVQIKLKTTGGKYHDRYIAIDYGTASEAIYHCGSSSKNAAVPYILNFLADRCAIR